MKSSELLPSYDNLRKTFVNDTIGRSADVIRFANMLNVIDSSFSIALDSSWGSGKTFFVKQVKMFLDANNDHVHAVPDPDKSLFQTKWSDFSRKPMPDFQPQVCVYYDAWANDGDEDPVLSLVYEIINDVELDYSLPKDGDCIKIASTVLDLFTEKNWTAVVDALRGEDPLAEIKKAKSIEDEIKNFLDSLLYERGNRLVVFVDELDRCRPSFAVKLLERIKHYFANDRITFVFSINSRSWLRGLHRWDRPSSSCVAPFMLFSLLRQPETIDIGDVIAKACCYSVDVLRCQRIEILWVLERKFLALLFHSKFNPKIFQYLV